MSLASREYVTGEGCGDRAACARVHRDLAAVLSELRRAHRIEGFLVRELHTKDDILDEDLDEGAVLDAAKHQLPVVWANVTYRPEEIDPAILDDLERRFGLRSTASTADSD